MVEGSGACSWIRLGSTDRVTAMPSSGSNSELYGSSWSVGSTPKRSITPSASSTSACGASPTAVKSL